MSHVRRSSLLLLCGVLFSCHAAPQNAHPTDSPPIILQSSPLVLPLAAEGAPPLKSATFKIEVLSSGKPGNIQAIQSSGDPAIDALCIASLNKYKFRPATSAGKPITASTTINFNFAGH